MLIIFILFVCGEEMKDYRDTNIRVAKNVSIDSRWHFITWNNCYSCAEQYDFLTPGYFLPHMLAENQVRVGLAFMMLIRSTSRVEWDPLRF